ncbi:NADP-dependent oxidoreductase [Catenuloplanes japonicus]|uniref:NADP-dependent oxidoreductase n=1 Tax=Catenuloplanes japonicus TaxID=33876 RepID=UPI00052422EA|nr:NADP-dependent oxidoreductase [Catenuloplanes japonicus]
MTDTMRAVRIHDFGGTEVLRYAEDVPVPSPGPDDVLVRVHAAAVNRVDLDVRQGMWEFTHHPFPMTLGWDFAGTVESVGSATTGLRVGDRVFGRPALTRDGTYAELLAVDPAEIAKAPESLPLEEAAALPLSALTAWKALFEIGELTAGQTVLILGGAGGVGTVAVQLAAHAGATVAATASGTGIALARSLGADEVIDYRTGALAARGRFADVVLDTIGGATLEAAYASVVPGGRLITVAGTPDDARAAREGIQAAGFILEPDGPRLAEIAALVDAGSLRPVVHRTFDLGEAAQAHEFMAAGHMRGKLVLRVSPR